MDGERCDGFRCRISCNSNKNNFFGYCFRNVFGVKGGQPDFLQAPGKAGPSGIGLGAV